ncbi:TetR/AcrR family transcriptional regulator [Sneathiella aquimaris]|uniref:TetR/AcrR family transcriptional regulator n=1 Tax=Sneathiella aquimaris TaxID=2599305 RepID=UPI00146C54BB|nr:TetR/AcrR family transcriptional regulator [Sneathiella aquimaris]
MKTKDKFLNASIDLFGSQGFSGTGIKQIVSKAGATWGSVYHFFPDGKDQLGVESVKLAAEKDNEAFKIALGSSKSLMAGIELIFKSEIKRLKKSNYTYGCAVASIASDVAASSDDVRKACSDAFRLWQSTISNAIRDRGVEDKRAEFLSDVILSTLEGATLMSRTHRSTEPMENAILMIELLLKDTD